MIFPQCSRFSFFNAAVVHIGEAGDYFAAISVLHKLDIFWNI